MTNEWNEYKAYIGQPTYAVSNGKDTSFLGRFTTEMIKDFKGICKPATAVKYVVALNKRTFLWDVLWEYVEKFALKY